MSLLNARVGLVQRVLPDYRALFFETLAEQCEGGLHVFAGQPRPEEHIQTVERLQIAQLTRAQNMHLLSGPLYTCWQRGLVSWLRDKQPDVLIMEANPRYLSSPGGVRWMQTHHRPVIGWGLGAPQPTGRLAGLRLAQRRRFLSRFDALITYSRQGADEYARLGFPAERIFVAPNAAAARPLHALPERPIQFANGKPTLIFVGRLQARKRVDLLLQACANLWERQALRLQIVGDGPARAELEALARQTFPQAEFLGAQRGSALGSLLAKADLFVLPGTGGLAIQEAMSWGLPVVAAEADGTQADLVREGNGWQLPPHQLDALIHTLELALSNPARLRRMGAESYRIVREEINLEMMVQVFENAIRSVLEK